MFYKIGNKYYVKLSSYYQEVEFVKGNIIPKKGEENRIYNPSSVVTGISYEDLLKIYKKKKNETKKDFKNNKFNVF